MQDLFSIEHAIHVQLCCFVLYCIGGLLHLKSLTLLSYPICSKYSPVHNCYTLHLDIAVRHVTVVSIRILSQLGYTAANGGECLNVNVLELQTLRRVISIHNQNVPKTISQPLRRAHVQKITVPLNVLMLNRISL